MKTKDRVHSNSKNRGLDKRRITSKAISAVKKLSEPPKHGLYLHPTGILDITLQQVKVATVLDIEGKWNKLKQIDYGLLRLALYLDELVDSKRFSSDEVLDIQYNLYVRVWVNRTYREAFERPHKLKYLRDNGVLTGIGDTEESKYKEDFNVSGSYNATMPGNNTRTNTLLYRDRPDTRVDARSFLERSYSAELKAGTLTLSDLRELDPTLWRGLRNWAHAGGHDLDDVIPRGNDRRGRPPLIPAIDPDTLDPDDPRDALALRALKQRIADRTRLQKWRAAKPKQ